MKLQAVGQNFVSQSWPLVEEHLKSAMPYAGDDFTLEQVKAFLASNQWLLIGVIEENEVKGALTVKFNNTPNDRIAFVTLIGGKLIACPDTYQQLKDICKAHGATKIQGAGRPAIVRLWRKLGFYERYMVVENKI
jgi:hypothetical protein